MVVVTEVLVVGQQLRNSVVEFVASSWMTRVLLSANRIPKGGDCRRRDTEEQHQHGEQAPQS